MSFFTIFGLQDYYSGIRIKSHHTRIYAHFCKRICKQAKTRKLAWPVCVVTMYIER